MFWKRNNLEQRHFVVGSRLHLLSIVSVGCLVFFVLAMLLLLAADILYLVRSGMTFSGFLNTITSVPVRNGIRMSLLTSLTTLVLIMMLAVPIGFALSRYKFPGRSLVSALVDIPIVLPPVVVGVSLLAFFGTPLGGWIRDALRSGGWSLISGVGIVMCQFLMALPYCIRATKASFDSVDTRLEHVAMSLGCSRWGAFRRITLPLAGSGLLAGGVMAWARAIGVFGPLMVFVGTSPRVQVMPTAIWLELSVGNIEGSLAIALVSAGLAGLALAVVHYLAPERNWA